MIVAGCDVGSLTAKSVILHKGVIVGSAIVRSGPVPEKSADEAMERALKDAGMSPGQVVCCVGTGYGRKRIPFVNAVESEIACHARGAIWQEPSVRMLVDIGGQDAKAVKFDDKGGVLRYVYNDKCASGTGRFLEIIAEALEISLDDLGHLSSQSKEQLTLSNQCVVFAETEILSLVSEGKGTADIIRALHNAVARRTAAMARSLGVEGRVAMTGGVARNTGMFEALREALGIDLAHVAHPQLNGAIGAALFAVDMACRPR